MNALAKEFILKVDVFNILVEANISFHEEKGI